MSVNNLGLTSSQWNGSKSCYAELLFLQTSPLPLPICDTDTTVMREWSMIQTLKVIARTNKFGATLNKKFLTLPGLAFLQYRLPTLLNISSRSKERSVRKQRKVRHKWLIRSWRQACRLRSSCSMTLRLREKRECTDGGISSTNVTRANNMKEDSGSIFSMS